MKSTLMKRRDLGNLVNPGCITVIAAAQFSLHPYFDIC